MVATVLLGDFDRRSASRVEVGLGVALGGAEKGRVLGGVREGVDGEGKVDFDVPAPRREAGSAQTQPLRERESSPKTYLAASGSLISTVTSSTAMSLIAVKNGTARTQVSPFFLR